MEQIMLDWHYPRTSLAKAYLAQFATGITSALTLFAPRRYGKTEFLLRDLVPQAEEDGYRVVYASMWASRTDPLLALLAALEEATRPHGLTERIKAIFEAPVKSVELEAEMAHLGKAKATVDFSDAKPSHPASALLQIPFHLDALIQRAKPGKVLLLLDEVQFLAKSQYEDMVAALRTALDVRKADVKVVYTGSSRVRLQRMFEAIKAPLFRASQTTNFPELDSAFVDYMLSNVHTATGRHIDREVAWKGFVLLSKSPGLFRDAIEAVIMDNNDDIVGLCDLIAQKAEQGAGYEETWQSFKDIDRALLRRVIEGKPLYTAESCEYLATEAGINKISPQQIQVCVNRLADAQILLSKGRGRYEIEDPGFSSWIEKL